MPEDSKGNGYQLSRDWFDFCFENPERISPNHTALYFFCIEHCNRLGWKEKFGLPTEMAKDALGIKNYRTFAKTFKDLIDWGFIKLIQRSHNQYSANIIAIVKNTKAHTKALDKAMQKHSQKQRECIVCIDKQRNKETNKQENKEESAPIDPVFLEVVKSKEQREEDFKTEAMKYARGHEYSSYDSRMIEKFCNYWTESNPKGKQLKFEKQDTFDIKRRLATWASKDFNKGTSLQAPIQESPDQVEAFIMDHMAGKHDLQHQQ